MWNKEGEKLLESKCGIKSFLDHLEWAMGGHGNGISLLKNGKIVYLKKGVKYSNKEIVDKLQNTDYDWCVYHTRVASVGSISDSNCHPFRFRNTVLAMNGTESGYKALAERLNVTDSETVLLTAKKFKLPLIDTLTKLSSVFMGFDNGTPYVAVGGGYFKDLEVIYEGDAIVFASEFPDRVTSYTPVKFPFSWTPKDDITKTELREAYHYSIYDNLGNNYVTQKTKAIKKIGIESEYFKSNWEECGDGWYWNFKTGEIACICKDNHKLVEVVDYADERAWENAHFGE
jgi:hypothetical protein